MTTLAPRGTSTPVDARGAATVDPGHGPALREDGGFAPMRRTRTIARVGLDLPPAWPIIGSIGLYPLWWALGLGGFIFQLSAIPLAANLLQQRRATGRAIVIPQPLILWFCFLVFAAASAMMLEGAGRGIAYLWRATVYLGCTIWFLWLYNCTVPDIERRVVRAVGALWASVVLLGFLALAVPNGELTTPVEALIPQGLLSNSFVRDLVHPRFAQVQDFLAFPLPRPAAPFPFSNNWGSTFAIAAPVFVLALATWKPRWRQFGAVLAVVSVIPLLFSSNRTAWATLVVGLVYAAIRLARRGRTRFLVVLVAGFAIVTVVIVATPLLGLITERLANPHSNQGRFDTYAQVLEALRESPLLGFGGPRPNANEFLPSLGTQGIFWLILFGHGIPAAVFFHGFLGWCAWRGLHVRDDFGIWASAAVLIALAQVLFYDLIPTGLFVVIGFCALLLRRADLEEQFGVGAGAGSNWDAR